MTTLLKNSYALGLLLFLWTLCSTRWYSHAFTLRTANNVLRDEFALMMNDDAPVSNGYSLLRSDVRRQHLKVVRSRSAPLHRVHLPIQIRAQKGQVCRVEVEEFQPLLSMVGYLEPKKFDCSFADGEVIYHHQGNPLANHDHVQVTISFFRNNNSVVQTVDIMVDVEDPSTESSPDASLDIVSEQSKERAAATDKALQAQRRVELLDHINVTNLKATSDSITPAVLRFYYDPATEECRLSYTSPDLGAEPDSSHKWSHQGGSSVAGTRSPRLGLPLAAGDAVGGMHRWPLFGQLVAFNRSTVNFFDLDCQEALLQGYRYMHRKPNSPATDYLPLQVVIWRREPDGTRTRLWREGVFLKVTIVNGQPLKRPMALIFRQRAITAQLSNVRSRRSTS